MNPARDGEGDAPARLSSPKSAGPKTPSARSNPDPYNSPSDAPETSNRREAGLFPWGPEVLGQMGIDGRAGDAGEPYQALSQAVEYLRAVLPALMIETLRSQI